MKKMDIKEIGEVKIVRKNIAWISGLDSCLNGQLMHFSRGASGLIMGFSGKYVLALILGNEGRIRRGDQAILRLESFTIPVGEGYIGRVVNAMAEPYDGKGPIRPDEKFPIMQSAADTMSRSPATEFLQAGTMIVDTLIPLAKGQRQIIIGDRMTGKTTVAIDIILHQKGKNVVCIYCCIGKSFSSFTKIVSLLKKKGALDYTIIAGAPVPATVGEQYLIPFTAATLGEYFMQKGREVVVVFDDLTKHSWVYRQISLLLERPPGREAYPGDLFYLHTQLLERAGRLSKEKGGGSMTFLPIVDTLNGDVTGLVPSNLISMSDGQIFLSTELFKEGFKPAIDFSQSVSIIGTIGQPKILKTEEAPLRLKYAEYRELQRLSKLKTDLSEEAKAKVKRGEAIIHILKQDKNEPVGLEEQIVFLSLLNQGRLDQLSENQVIKFKKDVSQLLQKNHALRAAMQKEGLTNNTKGMIEQCLKSLS